MLRIRIIGLALVAVFAVSAMAAGTASAAEHLEFGECVKLTTKTGKFTDENCTTESAKKEGEFEWKGFTANIPFTSSSGAGELLTVGGHKVNCTADSNKGEITGAKTDTVTVTFTNCTTVVAGITVKCTSAGQAAGTIVSNPLKSLLVWLKTTPPLEAGILLEPVTPPTFATFVCGGLETLTVRGSVIAPITALNVMSTSFILNYVQTGGKQAVTQYQSTCTAAKTKPATFETEGTGAIPFAFEESGITDKDTLSFTAKHEIWASC